MQNGEPNSEIIIYEGDGGQLNIEVRDSMADTRTAC